MKRLAVSLLLAASCASHNAQPPKMPAQDDRPRKLADAEKQVLAALGVVDGRLELRFGIRASDKDLHRAATELIVSEDPDAGLVDGRIDVFSFGARERALGKLKARIPAGDLAGDAKLERELLVRLIDAEQVRVAQEKALPNAASELVRGLVATWSVPVDDASIAARDSWLARRLEEIELAIAKKPLPRGEEYELEDALDPLESKIHAGYTHSLQQLAKLRVVLGQTAPAAPVGWPSIAEQLGPQIGQVPPPDALLVRLQAVESALRPSPMPDDAADRAVKKLLLDSAQPCVLDGHGSIMRSLGAPPERDLACRVVRSLSKSEPEAQLAMHRIVALALTTIAAHLGAPSPVAFHTAPELSVRAGGRPVDFVVAALAVEWLHAGANPQERAQRWTKFGDAPLDIALRELGR
jgi:hypothetical protein